MEGRRASRTECVRGEECEGRRVRRDGGREERRA